MRTTIFTDGAARGNPGPAGVGIVIKKGTEVIKEIKGYLGKTTNNVAEYLALIRGLEEALLLGAKEVDCVVDSELLARQVNGEYKVKNEGLSPLYHHLLALIKKFKHFKISHAFREENKHADELASCGIDEYSLKDAPLFDKM